MSSDIQLIRNIATSALARVWTAADEMASDPAFLPESEASAGGDHVQFRLEYLVLRLWLLYRSTSTTDGLPVDAANSLNAELQVQIAVFSEYAQHLASTTDERRLVLQVTLHTRTALAQIWQRDRDAHSAFVRALRIKPTYELITERFRAYNDACRAYPDDQYRALHNVALHLTSAIGRQRDALLAHALATSAGIAWAAAEKLLLQLFAATTPTRLGL